MCIRDSLTAEPYAEDRREEMLRAVDHCIGIWESSNGQSMEAYKASVTLNVMVKRLKEHRRAMRNGEPLPPPAPRVACSLDCGDGGAAAVRSRQEAGAVPWAQPGVGRQMPSFGVFPNGAPSDFREEDLPPEQSAAMTLGMLYSGGKSPNAANWPSGVSQQEKQGGYPASMAGLLNDPLPQQERTGLTPQYSGGENGGSLLAGPASPFSQMLAAASGSGGFMGLDGTGADIDWVSLPALFFCSFLLFDGYVMLMMSFRAHGIIISKVVARTPWIRRWQCGL